MEAEPLQETGEEEEELHFGKSLSSTDPPPWKEVQNDHKKKKSVRAASSILEEKYPFISSYSEKGQWESRTLECCILNMNKEHCRF